MIPAFLFGMFTWTLLEYGLHRFVFHADLLGRPFAADHLKHHAQVDWFVAFWKKALTAAIVVLPLGALGAALVGRPGAAWAVGVIGAWLAYEVLHRRIHVAAPIGAYGRWARRHHLAHHFVSPRTNHGVSSPIWDLAFGTLARPEGAVRVPRLHAGKLPWLVEGSSPDLQIRAAYAEAYRLSPGRP